MKIRIQTNLKNENIKVKEAARFFEAFGVSENICCRCYNKTGGRYFYVIEK